MKSIRSRYCNVKKLKFNLVEFDFRYFDSEFCISQSYENEKFGNCIDVTCPLIFKSNKSIINIQLSIRY